MEEKCYRKEYIACFGQPVDENPTVIIMEAAFKAMGLNYLYNAAEVYPADLEQAVMALKALHMKGANCTIPHKVEVIKYLDHVEADAHLIGAVNTVYMKEGETWGANTDGKGFMISLKEHSIDILNKCAVILGAGGAARAIAVEMALAGVKKITILNRNAARGQELTDLVNEKTNAKAFYACWNHTYEIPGDTDLLINATNIGLFPDRVKPDIDYNSLKSSMVVCDVIPNPPRTPFLLEAQSKGCSTLDGLSMLVNQGVIGLKLWCGQDAPADIMKRALEKEFNL